MGTEGIFQFSVASMVEDVLQQHGKRLSDIDLASRKAEEASLRRYEAAGWLRQTVGVVGGKDLPAEPSEEEFRLGLRSGRILCSVLNKVQPGAVPKVVEAPSDSIVIPDGAALSAYQYFENVRNFLVVVEEMRLPTFEASDLEQGGKTSRIVNCVLALKSYNEWKQGGGHALWKFGGNLKPSLSGKQFVRKNSEPFMNSFSRMPSVGEKSLDGMPSDLGHDLNETGNSRPLHMLVRELLSDKKQDDIPIIVENMLSKVMEEFERRLESQHEQIEDRTTSKLANEKCDSTKDICGEGLKVQVLKQQMLAEQHQMHLQDLKHTLSTTRAGMQFLQMKYQEEVNILGKHLHGLAHAASGYQKVLEENRRLYNQVQDLKGSIRVYCRVRPFLPGQPNRLSTVCHIDDGNIKITTPSKYGKEGRKSFTFNKVFGPSTTQEEVFSDTEPLIRSVLDGYNVCIFAYGQTGSGKTYTMSGPSDFSQENLGVNYRALNDLFLISEQRKSIISYDVSVQMIEIYNEQVRDLLVTDEIRNSSQNGINVPDANLVPVASSSDVLYLMNLGHKNRAVGATAMNDRSSRSHSCLTVHVQGRDLTSGTVLRGCMHLVDLAGSERVDKSEAVGDRLKEAQHINKSLSALGDVIASLAQKNSHVPYRNSKLTQLLQDSLGKTFVLYSRLLSPFLVFTFTTYRPLNVSGGQAKTLMFVHISPEIDAIGETISTLKFAERVSTVELGAARANKDSADVKELKEQIASLKAALARKEGGQQIQLQRSLSGSPERFRTMSAGSSPSHPSLQSVNMPGNHRQPMEDVVNIEVRNNSATKLRRQQSLDLQDLMMNSPTWPPVDSPGLKADRKEAGLGDWVDKVMVNKQNGASRRDESPLGFWEDDNRLPEIFYHKCTPDPLNIFPEQPLNKFLANRNGNQEYDVNRNRYEVATTDDSDLDAATSDCSEPDFLWQLNVPKVSSNPNGLGSKLKRPSPRQAKSPEIRSSIPPPTRRLPNGVGSPMHKTGRQPASADGKRRTGTGK
ncbi:hypothetical protein RJ639_029723 [Escallonia herrerae]|uniref:Uncharacterized protein n=1 Tax=Escallonia herrerae TaxID=1293975 RepID=A0AA88X4L1_9ASTE|nr:hypothetical protein RJ639_029723 [Escallonia herrerae]